MSDPKTPGDANLEFVKNSKGGLVSVKTLLDDMATIKVDHMQVAMIARFDALALSPLQDALKRAADMQSLMRELEAAQTAGDWENAESLTKHIVDVSGVPSIEPTSLSRHMANLCRRLKTVIWTRCAAFLRLKSRT